MSTDYLLVPEKSFSNDLKNLSIVHQKMLANKLLLLRENPFYPSLRTKKLKGNSGCYESSVNMSIRIIWEFNDDEADEYMDRSIRIISLLEVGHHDVLKQY